MSISEKFFEPSSLITILLIIILIIFGIVATTNPNANESFFITCQDAVKILCGALGGAVAGEKFGKKKS